MRTPGGRRRTGGANRGRGGGAAHLGAFEEARVYVRPDHEGERGADLKDLEAADVRAARVVQHLIERLQPIPRRQHLRRRAGGVSVAGISYGVHLHAARACCSGCGVYEGGAHDTSAPHLDHHEAVLGVRVEEGAQEGAAAERRAVGEVCVALRGDLREVLAVGRRGGQVQMIAHRHPRLRGARCTARPREGCRSWQGGCPTVCRLDRRDAALGARCRAQTHQYMSVHSRGRAQARGRGACASAGPARASTRCGALASARHTHAEVSRSFHCVRWCLCSSTCWQQRRRMSAVRSAHASPCDQSARARAQCARVRTTRTARAAATRTVSA